MYEDFNIDAKHPTIQQTMFKMALESLTVKQKRLWDMYAYDRLTQEEIAGKLGIKQQTVEQSIKRVETKIAKYVRHNRAAYMLLKLEHKIMNSDE